MSELGNFAEKCKQTLEAFERNGRNYKKTAEELGIHPANVKRRLKKLDDLQVELEATGSIPPDSEPSIHEKEQENGEKSVVMRGSKWSVGRPVLTKEDALEKANINLDEYYIVEIDINSWPTAMKLKTPEGDEKPHQLWNWQVKIKVRPRTPKFVQQTIKGLLNELDPVPSPLFLPRGYSDDPHMLELGLFDAHFGKLCWHAQVGHDYDTEIAERDFLDAAFDLLDKAKHYNLEKIILPLGNDFFQVNNWRNTTANDTRVSSDSRFQKVFRVGCRSVHALLEYARQIADVEVVWVPGNHDPETSWYMFEYLSGRFINDPCVAFDDETSMERKNKIYGKTLICYTHGNEEKMSDLPLIALTSNLKELADIEYVEVHVGHYHKKKEMQFVTADSMASVIVRILPSISGTDGWHYRKGYVNGIRAAEAHIYSFENGHTAYLTSRIKSDS